MRRRVSQIDLAKWRASFLEMYPDFAPRLEWVEGRMNRCESDLERVFVILAAFGWNKATIFSYAGEAPPGQVQSGKKYVVDFERQVQIAGYRCDFLLTVRANNGRTKRVAVECDGHSFHDRTPEQASADRRRDRRLIAEGVPTLRYTFSDLTKDPAGSMEDLRQTMMAIAAELCGTEAPE